MTIVIKLGAVLLAVALIVVPGALIASAASTSTRAHLPTSGRSTHRPRGWWSTLSKVGNACCGQPTGRQAGAT